MSNTACLLSIVIPTHNRSRYAIPCVQSLLGIASNVLQVVVHDTSDDGCELASWVKSVSDPRLKYVHWSERLSMTENHEKAVALADGEYICLIGDDDSVSSWLVDLAAFARDNGIDRITPRSKAMYLWPDFRSTYYGDAHAGRVYLEKFSGALAMQDSVEALSRSLSEACQGVDVLPKLYHGLVHRSLLDRLRRENGKIFFGTSPDVSAAVALALLGGEHHFIDLPLTLPGSAGGSNSGRSALKTHKGDIKTDPHMTPFKNINWPDILPNFFSVETVWAHAGWETIRNTEKDNLLNGFNLGRLYALCLIRHFDYRAEILAAIRSARASRYPNSALWPLTVQVLRVSLSLVAAKLKRLTNPSASGGREIVAVVDDVRAAREALDNRLINSKLVQDFQWRRGDFTIAPDCAFTVNKNTSGNV